MSVVPEDNRAAGVRPELNEGVQKDGTLEDVVEPPSQMFHPLSWEILALLMPASVFGVLARLGLDALTSYDGESIFPLAYVQGVGCLVMGFCLALKVPISEWCVLPLQNVGESSTLNTLLGQLHPPLCCVNDW